MNTLVIPCDDGDIVLDVDYDKSSSVADLVKLDADLKLIGEGKLDVVLPEDAYDYDKHEWETPRGKRIGELFAAVDAGVEF